MAHTAIERKILYLLAAERAATESIITIQSRESKVIMYKMNKHRQTENESQRSKIVRPKIQAAVQKLDKVVGDTSFECAVCLDTIKDAHILRTCLHRFCGACIKESLRMCSNECPKCREPIPTPDRQLTKDHNFDSLVSSL